MTHNTKAFGLLSKLFFLVFFGLALAACGDDKDSSAEQTSNDTTTVTTAGTGETSDATDYNTYLSVGEVKDGAIYGDLVLGNPDAPVTIIEYASLTCPHCADFDRETFPEMRETYIKSGKVKWIYRNFVRDRADLAVSMLTRCFGNDKVFDLMTYFFERQREWVVQDPMPQIATVARRAGINRADLDSCLAKTALQTNMLDLLEMGQNAGVSRTPTFFINGDKFEGAKSFEEMSELVDDRM